MEVCRLDLRDVFGGFSRAALSLGFVVFGLLLATVVPTVNAQQPVSVAASAPAAPESKAAAEPVKDLKTSLSELSTIYQNDVQRLEKHQQQSKQLFDDGLISRVEFEKGEKELADARAKVESVAKEIATANQPVNETVVPGM